MTEQQSPIDQKFSTLALKPELLSNLETMGFHQMTAIQAESLPLLLQGKDVIGQAKTGSGKTAAFGLALLQNLRVKRFRIQTMVLCPTRELAEQVSKEIRTLARGIHNVKVLTLCGGVSVGPQIGSLEHGAHIIVGTPGRIVDHLEKGRLYLDEVNTLILDEADRMLEMGFQDDVERIIAALPSERQTLLFSATFPSQIEKMAERVMRSPTVVKVASQHQSNSIEQRFYSVDNNQQRLDGLFALLYQQQPESAVIFCNTKRETKAVEDALMAASFSVIALHGDLEQRERDQALLQFANKSVSIMVATDVAARGLDIEAVDAVFNYELAFDAEVHTHRVGRTGRAGSQGHAYTFVDSSDDFRLALLQDLQTDKIVLEAFPELPSKRQPIKSKMITIQIDAGKKAKIRPGDILGALTGDKGIPGTAVGKIKVTAMRSFVAVQRDMAKPALKKLVGDKMKGKAVRAWLLE